MKLKESRLLTSGAVLCVVSGVSKVLQSFEISAYPLKNIASQTIRPAY